MKKLIALFIAGIFVIITAAGCKGKTAYMQPPIIYSGDTSESSSPPNPPSTGLENDSYQSPPVIVTQVPPPEITLQIPAPPSPAQATPGIFGSLFGGNDSASSPIQVTVIPPTAAPSLPQVSASDAYERMIVRTGIVQIVVEDIQNAIDAITGLTGTFNGYVVNSRSWESGNATKGSISIRVPAESYFSVLEAIRKLAVDVKAENTAATDVTDQYVDLQSQLTNLQASEQQLLEIMKKSWTVTEILDVQRELASTQGAIERIKGKMTYIENTSSTSLLQIDLEQSKLFATITVSTAIIQSRKPVTFRANVSGGFTPYSYLWDFGDGTTSTSAMPTHEYRGAGNYTVKLTVTDDHGSIAEDIKEGYINVLTGWSAGNTARNAWNGVTVLGQTVTDILIWLAYLSPVWIIIGVIIYLAVRRNKKRRAAREVLQS